MSGFVPIAPFFGYRARPADRQMTISLLLLVAADFWQRRLRLFKRFVA